MFSERVLERLQDALGVSADAQLARRLGKSPSTVSNWRARGSVPYDDIVQIAEKEGFSLDWLLLGRGPKETVIAEAARITAESLGGVQDEAARITRERLGLGPSRGAHTEQSQVASQSHSATTTAGAVLPDRDVLVAVIEALEETERYRRLPAENKARAILALYEIVKLTGAEPRQALKGSAA